MSCICQYIIGSSASMNGNEEPIGFPLPSASEHDVVSAIGEDSPGNGSTDPVTDDTKISVCVSELADCRAENWLLKKKLEEHVLTIQNLEHLMTTIMDKQHKMLADVFQLRQRNQELQTECNLQREYHTMERNALMKELCNAKSLNRDHMCALSGEEDVSIESDGREYEEQPESDVDKDNEDGYEDERSAGSSADSTAPSSANVSMYSNDSDSDESEEEEQESENELDDSSGTESESD
ncbi:glutamic acid-rich protein isoform X2 [Drosophila hydei]|uniref:Glutamic acid-rich protein isoform X2 n=1 Tax=Drosophila hydei TaxID=7224 RepID=A0A6J1LEN8_DROHY|nr:glutamic acid-rich protein isoform X2 [Drosophila hydei]